MTDSPHGTLENSRAPETPHDAAPTEPTGSRKRSGFRVFRVMALIASLLVVGLSAWACYVWITGTDGFDFRRFTFRGEKTPPVYAVRGQVFFNGEPIDHGHVEACPVKKDRVPDRIIGPIDEDGTFELYTDFDSRLTKGAPAGTYKLLLIVYHPTRPLEAPRPLLPPEYYDESTTPITITVTSDPENNQFVLKETGELQPKSGTPENGPLRQTRPQHTDRAQRPQNDGAPPED